MVPTPCVCVGSACTTCLALVARRTPKASGAAVSPAPTLRLLSVFHLQNIRVWDMLDQICLQSFCGKFFALGNCPITSAYFFEKDNTLICSTYSVSAVPGGRNRPSVTQDPVGTPVRSVLTLEDRKDGDRQEGLPVEDRGLGSCKAEPQPVDGSRSLEEARAPLMVELH
ncbi:hypothetical protein P7K49_009569 [Saguinus oedipus]|uniref:Uncharacterized protein n=1 Tax=Saguinus oedipus TaxID=9490 RepID=A0ABQ9VMM1_SAGOE|nr:hypothetical protein P7K49_009569 [Saguinus oedipus]